jgi:hypothetical protein
MSVIAPQALQETMAPDTADDGLNIALPPQKGQNLNGSILLISPPPSRPARIAASALRVCVLAFRLPLCATWSRRFAVVKIFVKVSHRFVHCSSKPGATNHDVVAEQGTIRVAVQKQPRSKHNAGSFVLL